MLSCQFIEFGDECLTIVPVFEVVLLLLVQPIRSTVATTIRQNANINLSKIQGLFIYFIVALYD